MIWNEHDWARVSFSFNQKSISIIYPTELQSWQWNGFWWFSFAIVSDALFMCFVMELLVCVFLCENVYLLLLSPEINCHLNWHAFVRIYQAVCDEYYPVGTRKHDCHTNNTNHFHFSSATAATTMKINSHHAIWQLKIQTVCYQCVEYNYAKKSHLLGLSVWW